MSKGVIIYDAKCFGCWKILSTQNCYVCPHKKFNMGFEHRKLCPNCVPKWIFAQFSKNYNKIFPSCYCNTIKQADMVSIKTYMNETDKKKLEEVLLKVVLNGMDEDLVYCPNPTCSIPYLKITKKRCKSGTCEVCQTEVCVCGAEYTDKHRRMGCKKHKKFIEETDESLKFIMLQKTKKVFKPCPKCNVNIEKNTGCNNMICKNCKCAFHWPCLSFNKEGSLCLVCAKKK